MTRSVAFQELKEQQPSSESEHFELLNPIQGIVCLPQDYFNQHLANTKHLKMFVLLHFVPFKD